VYLPPNLLINEDFHFGGYAKQNQELIEFASLFEEKYQHELDLVYGYKAMYGLLSLIKQEKIKHKRILYIHSGGL
jgi:1-aminocyclopropane-1-carboxylate deaminase